MGLEKVVLVEVAKVLKTEKKASFFNGTLFADCTAKEAAKIETLLSNKFMFGVIVSKAGEDFAFDLV
jgi:hypothetical protein